jgi:hypothetical protein
MSKKHKLFELNYHEALDRTYITTSMLQDYLLEHPVIVQNKKLKKKLRKAEKHMLEVYQMIGNLKS